MGKEGFRHHGDHGPGRGVAARGEADGGFQGAGFGIVAAGDDDSIESSLERTWRKVGAKPGEHGRRKSRETMPARSSSGFDQKMLETIVSAGDFRRPEIKRGRGNAPGVVSASEVEEGFPEEPLVGHPDRSIPVAVAPIIRSGLVHRTKANGSGTVLRGEQAVEQRGFLLLATCSRDEGEESVHAEVEVSAARWVAQEALRSAQGIVHDIAEYPCIGIP